MNFYPSEEEFIALAYEHNLIPVTATLSMDLETPIAVYYKIVGDQPGFILESAETSKTFGRYSFIGTEPLFLLQSYPNQLDILEFGRKTSLTGRPLNLLQEVLQRYSVPKLPDLPPFSGGLVGYLGFEVISTWERIRGMEVSPEMPLSEHMACRLNIVIDHLTHSARIIVLQKIPDAFSPSDTAESNSFRVEKVRNLYAQACQQIRQVEKTLQQPLKKMDNRCPVKGVEPSSVTVSQTKEHFIAQVQKAKEYIAAGDIFQVVLSQSFRSKIEASPFSLYRRLRQINPSPYMFFINFGARQLVGASPEMLVKLKDGEVFTCPIAGTRPRGKTPADDERLAAELLADEKERAEHSMLVDLGRNDIGRISLPGSVQLTRFMEVENFSHVMHIVSEVSGKLNPSYSAFDVLRACFPAGTVSGAPKIRAMEIIAELEPEQRGPYAGAVGYFDFRGNMDTCITIRTISIDGNEATIRTGAGIVADSVPESEYQEIRHKAKALIQVLGGNHL